MIQSSLFCLLSVILGMKENYLWGYLLIYKGCLPVYFKENMIFGTPIQASAIKRCGSMTHTHDIDKTNDPWNGQ